MSFDVMVSGGTLVDGTGAPPLRADVGISGDKVVAIGDLRGASARRIVDASGKLVGEAPVRGVANVDELDSLGLPGCTP